MKFPNSAPVKKIAEDLPSMAYKGESGHYPKPSFFSFN